MKLCLALLISLNLIHQIVSSNIVELDSSNLFGLFSKSDTFNIIRTDPLLSPIPTDKHKIISFKVFFEEQCAIKCLRNVHCIKYSYSSDQMCQIGLRDGFERRIEFYSDDADKITSLVNCDLNACSNGLYCSASSVTSNHGTCLCHPSDNGNACSAARDAYELSSWTEWTQCTANCDQLQGFKQRSKDCLRNNNATVNEMDWLCNGQDFSDQFEVESCSIDECLTYKEWSEWTSCSKICGGYMLRKRECFPGTEKSCNEKYLTEVKECSLKDCDNMLIALDQSELVSTNTDIIKRGYLKFQNVFTNQFVNIFSHSQDQTDINNIGHVVCQEFGFKKLDNANAIEAVDLRARFENDAEYDDFLKKKSITGIKCTGAEKTVKDCKTVHDSTDLFEIEIECSYDGYWTHWSSWSECSATCGAGAMTRSRSCQNPPPSISESDGENGLDCAAGKKLELTSCFKAKCEDNQIIF